MRPDDYEDFGMEFEDEGDESYQKSRDEESNLAGKVCAN
jgi:hypothetical protein